MSRRVLKWVVPVDDRDHPIGTGTVVHGQPVPKDDEHIGSAITGPLVWHVFASERVAP